MGAIDLTIAPISIRIGHATKILPHPFLTLTLQTLMADLDLYPYQSQSESKEEEEEEEEPARSLQNGPSIGEELEARVEEDGQHKRRRIEGGGEACSSNGSQENEWNHTFLNI
jgi:hypothetical protein